MLIIQLNKTDADLLYNNDYFKMIDAKDGVIYDDKLIAEAFTDSDLTPYKKFNDYMKEVSNDYLFYDLIHYKFIKEIPFK